MHAGLPRVEAGETIYVSIETLLGEPDGWHWRRDCPDYPSEPAIAQLERPDWRLCVSCWKLERADRALAPATRPHPAARRRS